MRVECPHCGAEFNLDSALAGEAVACPECGEVFAAVSAGLDEGPTETVQSGGVPITVTSRRPGTNDSPAFSFRVERSQGGDSGCCCGLIMLVAIIFILGVSQLLRGCLSLFPVL